MLSALKNYAITFLIAAIIFSLIAFAVVQIIMDSLEDSFFVTPDDPSITLDPALTTTEPPATESAEPLNGSSFNILLIGVDYAPNRFYDYDPELIEALTPQTEAAADDSSLTTNAPETIAPPASITVADETTALDTGILMPDGSLYFEGGFFSDDYRTVQTDTLILLRVDKERRQFTFTAFPPEMLLTIEGREMMLCDVFAEYGLDFLLRKINAMTGLLIDRYAIVNIDQFPQIIDTLGGITYNVPCDMKYDDYKGNLHIDLKAGMQPMDGEAVLHMLRFNSYTEPNQSRIKTAINFMRTLLQKMTDLSYLPKAPELYSQLCNLFITNFTAQDLTVNLDLIFKYGEYQLLELSFPGSYSTDAEGERVFTPNLERALEYFSEYKRIYE
ncbi:MAG: LCP family protein [Clostridia bacterium]|nr:LCP family protein [Clostridia bacterium]